MKTKIMKILSKLHKIFYSMPYGTFLIFQTELMNRIDDKLVEENESKLCR